MCREEKYAVFLHIKHQGGERRDHKSRKNVSLQGKWNAYSVSILILKKAPRRGQSILGTLKGEFTRFPR